MRLEQSLIRSVNITKATVIPTQHNHNNFKQGGINRDTSQFLPIGSGTAFWRCGPESDNIEAWTSIQGYRVTLLNN